ncbi:MAG: hypothetical protein AAF607_02620 [Pseudomonadota bacterium]
MSNVQLYSQVAAEVAPSLRSIVPEGAEPMLAEEDFAPEEFLAEEPSNAAPTMPQMPFRLRITGARPMHFTGRHLAMATAWSTSAPRWYEINLYETDSDEIICDVRLFHKAEGSSDLYRVTKHSDWHGAIDWLENYNTGHDIICDVGVDDAALSAAEVSLRGITVRQHILELKTQYQTILGNLLYELKVQDLD